MKIQITQNKHDFVLKINSKKNERFSEAKIYDKIQNENNKQ